MLPACNLDEVERYIIYIKLNVKWGPETYFTLNNLAFHFKYFRNIFRTPNP